MFSRQSFLPLLFITTSSTVLCSANHQPTVNIGDTLVRGTVSTIRDGIEQFLGLPFAVAPTPENNLRFKPTKLQNVGTSIGELDAIEYGAACLQVEIPSSSEDCLTLNIMRPNGTQANDDLPVLVWIHGGDFIYGSAEAYDGSNIVARSAERGTPIIFVSIQYRLGPLGFPQGPEALENGVLNLGLKDQIIALKWIKKYIGYFGGDHNKVTLWGESAGAHSIDVHFFREELGYYVRGAILESTYQDPQYGPLHRSHAPYWDVFLSSASCNDLACMRSTNVNSSTLVDAWQKAVRSTDNVQSFLAFNPVIDGKGGIIPGLPSQQRIKTRIPTILGTAKDEGTLFTPQSLPYEITEQVIRDWVIINSSPSPRGAQVLKDTTSKLLKKYYPNDPALGAPFDTGNETFGLDPQWKRWAAVWGDIAVEAHARELRHLLAELDMPLWGYQFADPDTKFIDQGQAEGSFGATHASDLPYLFGNNATVFPELSTPSAETLSEQMMDYWISFTVCGHPNDKSGSSRPVWKQYTANAKSVIELNGSVSTMIADDWRENRIGFMSRDPVVWHR